jgi:hypothetical protein
MYEEVVQGQYVSGDYAVLMSVVLMAAVNGGAALPSTVRLYDSDGVWGNICVRNTSGGWTCVVTHAYGIFVALTGAFVSSYVAGQNDAAVQAWADGYEALVSVPDAPVVEPEPEGELVPGPWPGSDPFSDPGPTPQPFSIPMGSLRDPSKLGTEAWENPSPGVTMPTTAAPAPYVPPAGTEPVPIPDPVPGSLGQGLHDAAAALDAAVPDMLGWLKAPFVAILNGFGDLLDWLGNVWSTVQGWVAGLFLPSDAGLTAAWTTPWVALQASAAGRWPFALGSALGTIGRMITSPGAATNSAPAVAFSLPLGYGVMASVNLSDWLQPLQPYKWIGDDLMWLWLVVALWFSFRPKVVT